MSEPCRVLFVDDEPNVLEALERAMFDIDESQWELVYEGDPEAATRLLEVSRFDVVVSDMRMPGVDGAELLARARTLQPHSLRIVLSGECDRATALRSVSVAHQFLAKPCKGASLMALVERSRQLEALVSHDDVRAVVRSVKRLPVRPRVYSSLVQLMDDERSTLTDMARLVENEPALCARVLQVVNSAFFGLPRKVGSIREAVNYLGTETLQSIVLCTEVYDTGRRKLGIDLQLEQYRAMVVGTVARALGGELAFTAGILHRVGVLISAMSRGSDGAANTRWFGHEALGAYLLGTWGLSQVLVEAVAFQSDGPPDSTDAPVLAAVRTAVAMYAEATSEANEHTATISSASNGHTREQLSEARAMLARLMGEDTDG